MSTAPTLRAGRPTNRAVVLAGADGCRGGAWIVVRLRLPERTIDSVVLPDARSLFTSFPFGVLVADIPIGLPSAGRRACDRGARDVLGARRSSVFSAPLRAALGAATWRAAHDATRRANAAAGLTPTGLSQQAFGILSRVADVDAVVTPALQARVFEGHPEVSFARWNGAPFAHAKRGAHGRAEREALVDARYGADARTRLRDAFPVGVVGHDDLLDAFACLWTAERIHAGTAETIPAAPERDARGLSMAIHA